MWSSLGEGAGKYFLPCLLPGESQVLSLAGHPQPSWAASEQQLDRWDAAAVQRGVLAALGCQWKMQLVRLLAHAGMISVLQVFEGCRAFHISYQANMDICSLNELWDDKFLGCWECANQPWFAWELGRHRAVFFVLLNLNHEEVRIYYPHMMVDWPIRN